MLVLAIVGAGGIFTGSNPSYSHGELAHHCRTAEVKFVISEPEILDSMLLAAKEVGIPQQRIWVFDVHGQKLPSDMKSWNELLKCGEADWIRFDDLKTAQETTAARLFSSGTTGLPKAVTITHYNLVAQHELAYEASSRKYSVGKFQYKSPSRPVILIIHYPENRYLVLLQFQYSTQPQRHTPILESSKPGM